MLYQRNNPASRLGNRSRLDWLPERRQYWYSWIPLVLLIFIVACSPTRKGVEGTLPNGGGEVSEHAIHRIALEGPAKGWRAELSGLAWYGDYLILLPQYPSRFGERGSGALFVLDKAEILAYLGKKNSKPLQPHLIPFDSGGVEKRIKQFEGFESILFIGDQVFLTIESHPTRTMMGYLVAGTIQPDLSSIQLDPKLVEIPPQSPKTSNLTDEAMLAYQGQIYTIYEANGINKNPSPVTHIFDLSLQPKGTLPFPNVEYRITDAAPPDGEGRFWAINTFFPPDKAKLKPGPDGLANLYGEGPTHARFKSVERLVEFQINQNGIQLSGTAPIQLKLTNDLLTHNWEGLALLDDLGFLLVTDMYPSTLLGFVSR